MIVSAKYIVHIDLVTERKAEKWGTQEYIERKAEKWGTRVKISTVRENPLKPARTIIKSRHSLLAWTVAQGGLLSEFESGPVCIAYPW
jgi:hypothetical protein